MKISRLISVCLVAAVVVVPLNAQCSAADTVSPTSAQLEFFETRIRPLLHAKCVKCHGGDQQKGELRLDSIESLLKGGESGPAAVAGKPAESLLLEAVRYESFEMPPGNPLMAEEVAALEKWIADGAAWPTVDGRSLRLDGVAFSADERSFWSLQPLTQPTAPQCDGEWCQNEIDQFVGEKLAEQEILPAPQSENRVLIRRLYFDLLGVPPSSEEIIDFERRISKTAESGSSATAIAKLVDQLLADDRYGEHWGRHWLDVVRYAESDGFRADTYRPDAWRYRDYVVNAFNTDKPYDQFVTEQLAGDEIAPEKAESLVATGYLRTYLYEYNQRDARTQWQDILNQVTDVTGEAFLGLGVGCARCHDHKFDPILQEDYYRLRASFGTMIPRDDIPAVDVADRQSYSKAYESWLSKGVKLQTELKQIRNPYMQKAATKSIIKFPEDIQVVMAKKPSARNPLEMQLADLVNRQILFEEGRVKYTDEDKKRIDGLKKQIAELTGDEPLKLPVALTVADVGTTPFPLHIGGNEKRKAVTAGGFSILDSAPFQPRATTTSTGQRTALAKWITDPQNPLTARVIVNRIWQQHFGTGIVATASDFGTLGSRPSHPELLDWLASEFIANGWSIKWLHRQILNSATWQMSSFHPHEATAESKDPANRLRWRFDIRRLNAEQIRDAMLTASGEIVVGHGGPSVAHTSLRRSLYLKMMRNTPEPLMRSLDGVDGLNSISKRSTTTTPTQALNLMNGDWVRKRSVAMAKRILAESRNTNLAAIADAAFHRTLGRTINESEVVIAADLIQQTLEANQRVPSAPAFGSLRGESQNSIHIDEGSNTPLATLENQPVVAAPFTVVGMFKLDSLYPDATVRTLISQWNSSNKSRGWAIGVTSEKSGFKPRNLILQVVTGSGYEVVASNLRPELDKVYLVCVSVEETESGKGKAVFRLQPVDTKYQKTQQATVTFKSASGITGVFPVVLGGRSQQSRHRWDGQIDQVAVFDQTLSPEMIGELFESQLSNTSVATHSPVASWDFDGAENPLADSSSNRHNLNRTGQQSPPPRQQAVAELCHVLLNSNEFVYID